MTDRGTLQSTRAGQPPLGQGERGGQHHPDQGEKQRDNAHGDLRDHPDRQRRNTEPFPWPQSRTPKKRTIQARSRAAENGRTSEGHHSQRTQRVRAGDTQAHRPTHQRLPQQRKKPRNKRQRRAPTQAPSQVKAEAAPLCLQRTTGYAQTAPWPPWPSPPHTEATAYPGTPAPLASTHPEGKPRCP